VPVLLAAISLALLPYSSRGTAAAQSKPADNSRVNLRVDVNLVTLEVIVVDKKGDPIRNLKKEDFHLFEDGKEQDILSFEEVTESTGLHSREFPANADGGAPGRGKIVMILFDDSHVSVGEFKATRDSAEKYVRDHMKPSDLFAVGSYNVSLTMLQNFTRDQAKVLDAIHKLTGSAESPEAVIASKSSAASRDSGSTRRGPIDGPPNTLSLYQSLTYKSGSLLVTLDALNESLAQIKGRKAVLLYSEEFSASVNFHNELMKTVNSARKADVAFYTVDARGLDSLDGAVPGQPTGPVARTAGGNPMTRPSGGGIDYAQFDRQSVDSVLRPLAKETGGIPVYNSSNFNQFLDEIDKELSNYYMLGFQPASPRHDGKFHRLEVKTDAKASLLKHRNGYVDRGPTDELVGTKEERSLVTVMDSKPATTQLPLTFRCAYFYDSPGLARIPVSVKIAASAVEIRKKGGQLGGDLHIMGAAYAEDGSVSARFSETQHISLDKSAEADFRKRNLIYRNYLKLRPGKYELRLAVEDEQGKIGSASQSLIVPAVSQNDLVASSLIVAEQVSRSPELLQNLQATLLEESDPLIFAGLQVSQSSDNQVPVNSPVQVFFKLYNLSGGPDQWKLVANVRLVNEKGEAQALPPFPLDQNLFSTGKSEIIVGLNLPFDKAAAGRYKLVIDTREAASNRSVTLETDLTFR
jgi:VWFA-related protein